MTIHSDNPRFQDVVKDLVQLDPKLLDFCNSNGFSLGTNLHGYPGRDLRKSGNPHLLISIYWDRNWRVADIEPNIEYSLMTASDYFPPDDPASVWRKAEIVAKSVQFPDLVLHLEHFLERSRALLRKWSVDVIIKTGEKQENLEYAFRAYLPGGDKWEG